MRRIYVKEGILDEAVAYLNSDMTFYGFLSHTKKFLKDLLVNPLNADVDDYLKDNSINRELLLTSLLDKGIVEKETKIEDKNGSDKFFVSYKIPKKNFERKMRRLYTLFFEKNEIDESTLFEDAGAGGLGGATSCGGCLQGGGLNPGAGTYDVSLGVQRRQIGRTSNKKEKKVNENIKRSIYITSEQLQILNEMGTADAGNYEYDVPMNFNGGNDPTYDHSNMIAKGIPNKRKGVRRKTK